MPYFDARARLISYLNGLGSHCSSADLLDVVRQVRLLLERKNLKAAYPTLSLYCNWYMHEVIRKSPLAWNILAEVNAIICKPSHDNPAEAIGMRLRLDTLRSEAIALLNSQGANSFLFTEDGNWSQFVFVLLHDLCGKPLRWPINPANDRRARSTFTRMMQHSTVGPDKYARELFLEHLPNGHEGPGFYWSVVVYETPPHQAIIKGQLVKTAQ
jgi:hypothetical protein